MGKRSPFRLSHFDPKARYDLYYEASRQMYVMRDVTIAGMQTWEQFDEPDEASDVFLTLRTAQDETVFLEASAVTLMAPAGTRVAVDKFG